MGKRKKASPKHTLQQVAIITLNVQPQSSSNLKNIWFNSNNEANQFTPASQREGPHYSWLSKSCFNDCVETKRVLFATGYTALLPKKHHEWETTQL